MRTSLRMTFARPLAITTAALMLHGCLAGLPPRESAENRTLLAEQIGLAEKREAAGDIPGALFHWRIASILAPDEGRVAENLERLEMRRQAEAKRLRKAGTRDLARGRTRNARRALLQALALDPSDRDTLERLRGLEKRRLDRQMTAKVARSQEALGLQQAEAPRLRMAAKGSPRNDELEYLASELDSGPTSVPGNPAQTKKLVELHLRRADDRFKQRRFDAALQEVTQAQRAAGNDPDLAESVLSRRREYAEWLYGSGIRLASSDPQKARALLRQTLRFEPGHAKAAVRIKRLPSP